MFFRSVFRLFWVVWTRCKIKHRFSIIGPCVSLSLPPWRWTLFRCCGLFLRWFRRTPLPFPLLRRLLHRRLLFYLRCLTYCLLGLWRLCLMRVIWFVLPSFKCLGRFPFRWWHRWGWCPWLLCNRFVWWFWIFPVLLCPRSAVWFYLCLVVWFWFWNRCRWWWGVRSWSCFRRIGGACWSCRLRCCRWWVAWWGSRSLDCGSLWIRSKKWELIAYC